MTPRAPKAVIRVGISGWRYPPWRGTFYPDDLPQRDELGFAASRVPVIEINGTFYSLQNPASFRSWHAATPPGFLFTVKGSRYITHILRLKDVRTALANFFAQGLFELRDKLGPILWQFPPNFSYDEDRLRAFLDMLPFDTRAAAALARRHDGRVTGRARVTPHGSHPLRHAIEVRHASFESPRFVALLREYGVALVVAETARKWPMFHDITADFVYMRLHGDKELYRSGYSDRSLDRWARRIRAWHKGGEPADAKLLGPRAARKAGRDVYCFFDNKSLAVARVSARRRLQCNPGATGVGRPLTKCESRGILRAALQQATPDRVGGSPWRLYPFGCETFAG